MNNRMIMVGTESVKQTIADKDMESVSKEQMMELVDTIVGADAVVVADNVAGITVPVD